MKNMLLEQHEIKVRNDWHCVENKMEDTRTKVFNGSFRHERYELVFSLTMLLQLDLTIMKQYHIHSFAQNMVIVNKHRKHRSE